MPTTRLATIWHVNDKSLSVRQTNPIANVLRYKSLSSLCWCVYCTFHDYLQKLNWTHECTKLNMWSLVSKRTWIFPSVRRPLSALSMRIFLTEDSLQKMFRAWTKPRWKHLFVQLYRMPEVTNVKIWSRVYTRAFSLENSKNFRKFQHFLNYRRNSDKISSKSEQKSVKRIQK